MVVALGIDRQDDTLAAKTLGSLTNQFRPPNGSGVDGDLVGTGPQDLVKVVNTGNTAADGKGNGYRLGDGSDDVQEDMAFLVCRRNIVKDEFVCQLV